MAAMTEAEAKAYHERRDQARAKAKRAFLSLPLNQIAQANQYTTSIKVQPAAVPMGREADGRITTSRGPGHRGGQRRSNGQGNRRPALRNGTSRAQLLRLGARPSAPQHPSPLGRCRKRRTENTSVLPCAGRLSGGKSTGSVRLGRSKDAARRAESVTDRGTEGH
jgi:hypothetical protein